MKLQELQIYREIQHMENIHNKAVYDSFNEALNLFRPYYQLGGAPYLWTFTERNLTVCQINLENIDTVFERAVMKVLEWAQYGCGLQNDAESL